MLHEIPDTIDIVFFGTHAFAVEILHGLVQNSKIRVVHVITQPDRPVGRKQILQAPPVKVFASAHNLPISQPSSLKGYVMPEETYHLNIVAQYGKIIPKHIIENARHGTINVHTSLLPKYRGASPIQSALLNGESETGVTIMLMDEGLDTGPILRQQKTNIAPDETSGELEQRLAVIGKELLVETIPQYISGTVQPIVQDNSSATFCKQLTREEGCIDWSQSSTDIYNRFRAFTPWPGVWTTWDGQRLKLLQVIPATQEISPGRVVIYDQHVFVGCGQGSVEVPVIQLEGKKPSLAADFIKGYPKINGALLT